jgi:hypothetical protein
VQGSPQPGAELPRDGGRGAILQAGESSPIQRFGRDRTADVQLQISQRAQCRSLADGVAKYAQAVTGPLERASGRREIALPMLRVPEQQLRECGRPTFAGRRLRPQHGPEHRERARVLPPLQEQQRTTLLRLGLTAPV